MPANPIKRSFVLYNDINNPMSSGLRTQVISKNPIFSDGAIDTDCVALYNALPGFKNLKYRSISDSYTSQITNLVANEKYFGTAQDCFALHLRNDTNVSLLHQTNGTFVDVFCKGFGGPHGTATTLQEARCPVYYDTQVRFLNHFATTQAMNLWLDTYVKELLNIPFDNTNDPLPQNRKYPGGIWLDNGMKGVVNASLSASQPYTDSGEILEHPAHAKLNSPEFIDWNFFNNFGLFSKTLTQFVDSFPAVLGGRKYYTALNVATLILPDSQAWVDAYVTFKPAHAIFLEFLHHPAYFAGLDFSYLCYLNQKKASDAGIVIWETGYQFQMTENNATINFGYGSFTQDEMLLSTLADHWLKKVENTHLIGYPHSWVPTGENGRFDWQTLNLKTCWDIDLGQCIHKPEDPWVIFDGYDPLPTQYAARVYCREFENGLVLVRRRGSNTEGCYTTGAITVKLPFGNFKQVLTANSGLSGNTVTTASIRNGQGLVFVRV